ncbi:MAG: sugar ABC transporter permease [Roseburia sp.]|nr:sugar ABC transporter permease [Roseburia sp.]
MRLKQNIYEKEEILKRKKWAKRRETFSLDMMVLPGMLILFIFNYVPMIWLVIAFKDYNPNLGVFGSPWNGLENFKFFFTSQDAARVIGNTLKYSVTFLILDTICSVGLALMFFNLRSRKALKFYNTVVILPKFLSAVIIAFIVYIILNPSYGLLNQVIVALGGNSINWYTEAEYWPVILTVTHIWQTVGMNCIIQYAALMSLDESLLEAARLDGASKWQETWHVVIPHLIPVIIICTILSIGNLFQGDFGLFYQTPKDVGLLYPTTDVINTYTYRALRNGSFEKSTAVGLFQSIMGCILVIVTNKIVQKNSPENSLF